MSCMAELLCTCLPIPIIMRLHMPLRDRIGVVVLLSAGIIVTIAGILRTVFIWQALIGTYDESWHTYPLWICAAVEIDLAVVSHTLSSASDHVTNKSSQICACVPAMKAVLWKPFQRWTGSLYSSYRSSNRGTAQDKSKVELTSQDPIVEDNENGTGYRLNSMDFGKGSPGEQEEERYPSRLEKKLGRLPSSNHGGRSSKNSPPSSDEYFPSKLEISKETTVQVSSMNHENDGSDDGVPNGRRQRNSKPSHYNTTPNIDWD